ncbi:hypothetical protein B0H17DRAFT_77947 [Mycena rosella]|uniref:Zn(2)-C6 fungal-type domain-containing protein n=1 Tax=Mycena rosella TaxID=1033263 RepID=A0AAD7D6J0_MYCRO|nr:hypothetical protein B0H17DRAFT_77947 [Mycena rosella]
MSTMLSKSTPPTETPPLHPAPFAIKRRRTILACSNCRKRKIRCITTEQPPVHACARCTKRGMACEYVVATDDESRSPSLPVVDLPELAKMQRTPPLTGPSLACGSAPPLPYPGPPPRSRAASEQLLPAYASSSFAASNHRSPNLGYCSPTFALEPAAALHPGNSPNQMGSDPSYYAPQDFNFLQSDGYDLRAVAVQQYPLQQLYASPAPAPQRMADQPHYDAIFCGDVDYA